ncbi:MAG: ComEC/Rec2 family competence protein [Bdellovibrionaceae bacterium]|nr:ComEC/Rec2 family competence protein [Pseudobdellovibrionaceae bacterium]MDW8190235.1 ComEC/Rec2 family competence protein [Pseudobdellovibrionaceae bacterium]
MFGLTLITIAALIQFSPFPLVDYPHQMCLNWFTECPREEFLQALFCGRPLPYSPERQDFIATQLIHVLVVSGFHLTLLSNILNRLFPYSLKPAIPLFLTGYALMTRFQPPVVRALLETVLINKMRPHNAIIWSYLLTLCLMPQWSSSLSFQLSIVARSVLFIFQNRSLLTISLVMPLFLSPLIFVAHPLVGVFSVFLIHPILMGLFTLGSTWIILEWFDCDGIYFVFQFSQTILDVTLFLIKQLSILFPPITQDTFSNSGESLKITYTCFILGITFLTGVKRYRKYILFPLPTRETPFNKNWRWILGVLLFFQPQVLHNPPKKQRQKIDYKSSAITRVDKVDIPYPNPGPQVHNKRNHYKR